MIATRVNSTADRKAAPLSQIPQELLSSTPRDVAFNAAGKALMFLGFFLLIASLGAGVALYVKYATENEAYVRLTRDGVPATARIVQTGRTREDRPRRYVVYEYSANDQTLRHRSVLSRRDKRKLEVGEPITIRYVPESPKLVCLPGYERRVLPMWVVGVVPLSLLIPIPLLINVVMWQRRLLSEGRPALARVVSVKRVSGQHGARHRVEYEFQIMSGAHRKGRYDAQKKAPSPGANLAIVYDRDCPERSSPYPLAYVRIA